MTRFTITCFCTKNNIRFRSPANYGAEVIARVYCPKCSDRAPDEALIIHVEGVAGKSGVYAIDWNQDALKNLDPQFHDHEHWYRDFFGKKKLIFDFIPPKSKEPFYTLEGLKEEIDFTELSTRDRMRAEVPTKLPKKNLVRDRESPRPFSGGKEHR